ncbi:MAG: metalloprotease PmbA [Buchnera aphidicola (Chaetogeoica yunlongensis)]
MIELNDIVLKENRLKKIIEYILNVTQQYSICFEVIVKQNSGVDISVRDNKVESIEFNKNNILTIIIYKNNRKCVVSSTDLNFSSIHKIIDSAMNIVSYSSSDVYSGLPDEKLLAIGKTKDLCLYFPWKLNINYAIELLKLSEQEAFKEDKRIFNTEGSNFSSCVSTYAFGNSLGMIECYSTTLYSMSCCVIAKQDQDMQRDFSFSISRDINNLYLPGVIGRNSAKKALSRLNSRKVSTIKVPIIFSSEIASDFFFNLAKAIDGSCVYRKSTFLLNSLNKSIFPNWLTIEEYPHLKGGLLSRCFDAEGVETKPKKIVDKGILKTWLLDTYSARRMRLQSTGNAGGMHNWLVLGYSNFELEKLFKIIGTGMLITELLGQGVSITTGNYSHGVFGFWIENGVLKYPVSEVTISGNLKEMFKGILCIGNDIDKRQGIQSGSIVLSPVQISGL